VSLQKDEIIINKQVNLVDEKLKKTEEQIRDY
jgi:hypothetical protein